MTPNDKAVVLSILSIFAIVILEFGAMILWLK